MLQQFLKCCPGSYLRRTGALEGHGRFCRRIYRCRSGTRDDRGIDACRTARRGCGHCSRCGCRVVSRETGRQVAPPTSFRPSPIRYCSHGAVVLSAVELNPSACAMNRSIRTLNSSFSSALPDATYSTDSPTDSISSSCIARVKASLRHGRPQRQGAGTRRRLFRHARTPVPAQSPTKAIFGLPPNPNKRLSILSSGIRTKFYHGRTIAALRNPPVMASHTLLYRHRSAIFRRMHRCNEYRSRSCPYRCPAARERIACHALA